jgi:hypothetical protein
VAARGDVQPQAVRAGERGPQRGRIGGADVEPDRAAERERQVHEVVAGEVLRVVERTRRRRAAALAVSCFAH